MQTDWSRKSRRLLSLKGSDQILNFLALFKSSRYYLYNPGFVGARWKGVLHSSIRSFISCFCGFCITALSGEQGQSNQRWCCACSSLILKFRWACTILLSSYMQTGTLFSHEQLRRSRVSLFHPLILKKLPYLRARGTSWIHIYIHNANLPRLKNRQGKKRKRSNMSKHNKDHKNSTM